MKAFRQNQGLENIGKEHTWLLLQAKSICRHRRSSGGARILVGKSQNDIKGPQSDAKLSKRDVGQPQICKMTQNRHRTTKRHDTTTKTQDIHREMQKHPEYY